MVRIGSVTLYDTFCYRLWYHFDLVLRSIIHEVTELPNHVVSTIRAFQALNYVSDRPVSHNSLQRGKPQLVGMQRDLG